MRLERCPDDNTNVTESGTFLSGVKAEEKDEARGTAFDVFVIIR
jgi:hypothetical protein